MSTNGKSGKDVEDGDLHPAPKDKVTTALVVTTAVSCFGGSFINGWNTGVLNAPSQHIKNFLNSSYTYRTAGDDEVITEVNGTLVGGEGAEVIDEETLNFLWALTVALFLLGGCAGAFSASLLANRFGRRGAILFINVFTLIAAILFGLCRVAHSFEMLIIARIIVGYACGAGGSLVPMYIIEISPVRIRGALGVSYQLALTVGILVSQLFGLRQVLGNATSWAILLALVAVPAIVCLAVLPWYPESPRFLYVNRDSKDKAEKALRKFRGREDVSKDMVEMEAEVQQQRKEPAWSLLQLLRTRSLRLPLLLVCSAAIAQQLSGINVVFFYSTGVFKDAGIPDDMIQYAVVCTGAINVLMTIVSVVLMEKWGRRPLLIGGMEVMAGSAIILTLTLYFQETIKWLSYVSLLCILLFIVGFAIGLGPIPHFLGGELFKQGPRPPAMSLATFCNWTCNFIVAITFPFIQSAMKSFSFIPFIIILILFSILFWIKLPETKNKSFDEIYRIFKIEQTTAYEVESLMKQPEKNKV